MQQEIECKFINVDHDVIRDKLKALGAKCVYPMRLMRRSMFDYPDSRMQKDKNQQRLRIRDEGDKITITYKKNNHSNYSYEVETEIGSYEEMAKLLTAIGLVKYSYQESKRETWKLANVKIELDEWPWLDPYFEIEGYSEEEIKETATKLGFDWKDAKFGSVDTVYQIQYINWRNGDSIGDEKEVRFGKPMPGWFKKGKL